jgi:hydrogenase maturation protease
MNIKTLVVGLGNPILGDDGVGWLAAQEVEKRIAELNLPGVEVDCLALGGLSLMERLDGYTRAIIIDAIQTGEAPPGTVRVFPLEALPDRSAHHLTAIHDTSLQTALAVGRSMGVVLPEQIWVVGIEAEQVYDFSETVSPAVAAALPEACQKVLNWLAQ